MPSTHSGPVLISGGRLLPITASQYAAARRGERLHIDRLQPQPKPTAAEPSQAVSQQTSRPVADRESRRTAALQRVAKMGGPDGAEAKRILAEEAAAAARKAEADRIAALPRSIEEAGGDVRKYARASMERLVSGRR